WPTACAAAWTSARSPSVSAVPGLTSMAIVPAFGTSWRSRSNRLPPTVALMKTTPVTLPPGRLRLGTSPSLIGSLPVVNTIGIVVVDDLARIGAKGLLIITEGRGWRAAVEKDEHRYWLLRPSAAWKCDRRTAYKCNEFAPPHCRLRGSWRGIVVIKTGLFKRRHK